MQREHGFAHEAFLYAGDDTFVERVSAFAREGVEAGEPVLLMVGAAKLAALRDALADHGAGVTFADMRAIGTNPGRIIPAWAEFLAHHADAAQVRGVGEPTWWNRRPAEVVESQHHEALLNLAFADASQMWLVCPYDVDALPDHVIAEARHTHPWLSATAVGDGATSPAYGTAAGFAAGALGQPLDPPVPAGAETFAFDRTALGTVRSAVLRHSTRAGLEHTQVEDFVVAVNEVATNSVTHGGGAGTLAIWDDLDTVICELRDAGRIVEPLVGRRRPDVDAVGGAGLYLAHQFCDLVQLRSTDAGTTVRLHMRHR
jgi:anti-sigma regulatory factor (Ser/Thr protein kinase)